MLDLMFLTAGAMAWLLFYFILRSRIEGDPYVPPVVLTTSLPRAYVGEQYEVKLARKGTCAAVTWHMETKEQWLHIDPQTGVVLGAPPDFPSDANTCPFVVNVRISSECSVEGHATEGVWKTLTGEIRRREDDPPPLLVMTSALPAAVAGESYCVQLSALGGYPFRDRGNAHYNWEIVAGNEYLRESGLALDSGTGTLSGTVRAAVLGNQTERTVQVQFQVSDKMSNPPKPVTIPLTFKALIPKHALAIIRPNDRGELPQARAGQPFYLAFSALGGEPPYKWDIANAPEAAACGLTLDAQHGVLSATSLRLSKPGAKEQRVPLTVAVYDAKANPASAQFMLPIKLTQDSEPVQLLTNSLPVGVVGYRYRLSLSARYGMPPYTWEVANLPSSLTVSADGCIEGKPSQPGRYQVQIKVSDGSGGYASNPVPLDFTVQEMSEVEPLRILTNDLPRAVIGQTYDLVLAAKGGRGAYRWSGVDAAGFTVTSDGHLRANPVVRGDDSNVATLQVAVYDEDGRNATTKLIVPLVSVGFEPKPLRILTDELPTVVAGDKVRLALSATGGVPDYTWKAKITYNDSSISKGVTLTTDGILALNLPEWPEGHPPERVILALTVSDSQIPPVTDSRSLEFMVVAGKEKVLKPWIPDGPLPLAVIGQLYKLYVPVRGGLAPYLFELQGTLPKGMSFDNQEGCIYGTPKKAFTAEFRVLVTDMAGDSVSVNYRLDTKKSRTWFILLIILVIAFVLLIIVGWYAVKVCPRCRSLDTKPTGRPNGERRCRKCGTVYETVIQINER
jgi:hypothetical protein